MYQVKTSVDEAVRRTNISEMLYYFKKCKHLHIDPRTNPATYTLNTRQGGGGGNRN